MPSHFKRKPTRLKYYDYTNPSWYYVTICTKNFVKYFGEVKDGEVILNDMGKIVNEEWNKIKEIRENVELDDYVIMPNHLHGIIIINPIVGAIQRIASTTLQANSLGSIIGQLKSKVTKRINRSTNRKIKIWQRNYYDHIIRNEKDLYRIRKYILENPIKWEVDTYFQ